MREIQRGGSAFCFLFHWVAGEISEGMKWDFLRTVRNCFSHVEPPSVRVAQTAPFNTREPVMLACYVWGFYPADVVITWMKNGQLVTPHNIKERAAQSNGDWTYQTVSYLALTPSYGDIYTCVVQHSGTPEPVRQDWSKCMGTGTLVVGKGTSLFGPSKTRMDAW